MPELTDELKEMLKPQVEALLDAEGKLELAKESVAIARESGDDVSEQTKQLAEIEANLKRRRVALERRGLIESG